MKKVLVIGLVAVLMFSVFSMTAWAWFERDVGVPVEGSASVGQLTLGYDAVRERIATGNANGWDILISPIYAGALLIDNILEKLGW